MPTQQKETPEDSTKMHSGKTTFLLHWITSSVPWVKGSRPQQANEAFAPILKFTAMTETQIKTC